MSAFYDRAEEIAAMVELAFAADAVEVLVERGRDLTAEFEQQVAQVSGAVVLVSWQGASDVDEDIDEPRLANEFRCLVACHPSLNEGAVRPDDVVEKLCRTLNGWNPSGQNSAVRNVYLDLKVREVKPMEDDDLVAYTVKAVQTIQL